MSSCQLYGKSRLDHWEEGFFDVFLFVLFVDKNNNNNTALETCRLKADEEKVEEGIGTGLEAVQELVLEIRRKKMR